MATILPTSYSNFPDLPPPPDEQRRYAPLPLPTQTASEKNIHSHMHGSDFGRMKAMLAMKLTDEDAPENKNKQHKRKRRFFKKQRIVPKELRGKGHPAGTDERYRRVFPWRDQSNQLHVHPDLADPADKSKVDTGLLLLAVKIDQGDEGSIRRDIAKGLSPEKRVSAQKLNQNESDLVDERYQMLLASLYASITNVMRGDEPVPPEEVYIRALEDGDLTPTESALKGQFGLFNRKNAEGKWRTVSEGKHLSFFSGFFCRTAVEYERECARYSQKEVAAYALTLGEADFPCVSPYGGGDLGQFANSAITKDGRGRPIEDEMRTNTRFAYAEMIFEDNRPAGNGRRLTFPLVFLYMLAKPEEEEKAEREARVCYGQAYWDGVDALSRL